MTAPSIGVNVDDFRLSVKGSLRRAAELAFHDIEIAAVSGDLAPENLSQSGRRHFVRYAKGLGLSLAALVADMPGLLLTDQHTVDERVARSCLLLELAADLDVRVVTARIGQLAHPETGTPSSVALQALARIGEEADARGLIYALRPVGVEPQRLAEVLGELRCPGLGITADPAAMVMSGCNPMALLDRLGKNVALIHARDGTAGTADRHGTETALGEGDVDLTGFLAVVDVLEYRGPYVLRRTNSITPVDDLQADRKVLSDIMPTS